MLVSFYIVTIVALFVAHGRDAVVPSISLLLGTIIIGVEDFRRDLEYLTSDATCLTDVNTTYYGSETFGLSKDTGYLESLASTLDQAFQTTPEVHRGFAMRAIKFVPWVTEKLADHGVQLQNVEKIYVSGHSLGGAAALAFADCMLKHKDVKANVYAYVFSAPDIGNSEWKTEFDDKLGKNTYQHSLVGDPVPYFPPWLWKVGHELKLSKSRSSPEVAEWPKGPVSKHIKVDYGLIPYLNYLLNEKGSSFLEVAKERYGSLYLTMDGKNVTFEDAFSLKNSSYKPRMEFIQATWTPSGHASRQHITSALSVANYCVVLGSFSWALVILKEWAQTKDGEPAPQIVNVFQAGLDLLYHASPVFAIPASFLFIALFGKQIICDLQPPPRK